jgi:hypothetical protein
MLPAPGFHHLHLNSVDPDAAVEFYARRFPTTKKASWGSLPALAATNNVLVLFEEPYRLGDTRAVLIEGPSREALELVEVGGNA